MFIILHLIPLLNNSVIPIWFFPLPILLVVFSIDRSDDKIQCMTKIFQGPFLWLRGIYFFHAAAAIFWWLFVVWFFICAWTVNYASSGWGLSHG